MLYGGNKGSEWSKNIAILLDDEDERDLTYFEREENMPYNCLDEINDALKNIETPITLAQANLIATQANSIGVDEDKNGWAIAVAAFEKSHKIEDDKWVKKEESDLSAEDLEKKMSADNQKKEKEDENSVKNQKSPE